MTTHREACGTLFGLLLHRDLNEPLCGTCALRERARIVTAERIAIPEPVPPSTTDLLRATIHALASAMGTPNYTSH